jgi:ribose-phosphate pyrophosphokinase
LYDELKVFCGNAHPELADEICEYLGIPLGRMNVFEFSNENIFVQVLENVRSRDVFVVQPICTPVNKNLMELLISIDAMKRASAGRITAVMPYYGYSRTDKKDQPRVPITARLVADLLTVAGADRVLTVDLHAGQIQGFFSIPVDELTAVYLLRGYVAGMGLDDLVVVATDVGITKRARDMAESLGVPLAIIEKRRVGNEDMAETLTVIGDVQDRPALLVDDEVDTGGSIANAAEALKEHGAGDVYACCTHAILSGGGVERIGSSILEELVVVDTVPVPEEKRIEKITVLPVSSLIGEAIHRIHAGLSVGAMFQ